MGNKTAIAWTDETANWIVGCTKTRAKGAKESGCDNCYAATAANSARLQQFPRYQSVVDGKGNWNGKIEFVPKVLKGLLIGKKRRRVFTPSMSDPFHERVKDEWLDQFFAVVRLTPHITYQVLTKRPSRMLKYFSRSNIKEYWAVEANIFRYDERRRISKFELPGMNGPFQNLWLGVSAENQSAANERIPLLLQTPATVRFISVEPMLEKIDIGSTWMRCKSCGSMQLSCVTTCGACGKWHNAEEYGSSIKAIDWIIIGGESGAGARPFHLEWARSLIDQCRELGTAVFMKQVGSNAFYEGKPFKTKSRAGSDPSEWPEWARIQEFPASD